MTSFIHDVLKHLQNKSVDFSQLTFILPSKRAGAFLKHELSQITSTAFFAPSILSIEEFIQELSQLQQITNTELLFEFYKVYLDNTPSKENDTFDSFSKWAQILIQDFNEIDRYLIDQNAIFDYLSAIKDINHWSVNTVQTDLIKNYLSFWKNLKLYYHNLSTRLINKGVGYQGLLYREAIENLENYIQLNSDKQHVFIGFNALNSAESTLIQELLHSGLADIFWDTDEVFLENKKHAAGHFLRTHKINWNYFKTHPFNWIKNNYTQQKNIQIIGTPKNVGQAKFIGELLRRLNIEKGTVKNTAIVLGDENLLIPVINSIPKEIEALNITMGFPLRAIPLASLFEQLFLMHKDGKTTYYYKDVIALLSHQFILPLLDANNQNLTEQVIADIQQNNLIFLSKDKLNSLFNHNGDLLTLLFESWENNPKIALKRCLKLIIYIKNERTKDKNHNLLSLEYLYRFNEIFNVLETLQVNYNYINSIKALQGVYKELLSSETLDFQGEPLQGLQIMGMLESRVLDFETVIISSVNEGILPSGKSNNSFIPFDVKLENGLPTYKEKDAVYTYHFYRLLQRAKNVYIIYNTEPDVLNGGEKSRFITQMEIENLHNLNQAIVTPQVPQLVSQLSRIKKTVSVIDKIKVYAAKGFSPSSLTNYMRNPMDFYYQKVLGIKEKDEVEEVVAANTLGTIIHNSLEDLYKPYISEFLTIEIIQEMKTSIDKTVNLHFKKEFKEGDIKKGKNLIIYEIAKRYILNFLNLEIEDLKQGNLIKILAVEAKSEIEFNIKEIDSPILLTGKVDRVDEYNGLVRIIDYKTGRVESNKVEVINWEDLTTDYDKYSKSFQVLMYAYMMSKSKQINLPVEAGIISFKSLNKGVLKFSKKESAYDKNKDSLITETTLNAFESELKKLILEIFNTDLDFIEKEV